MQRSFDLLPPIHLTPVEQYLHLTRTVMPALAQTSKRHWPVHNDHCFQRIVLDTICSGVWYDHIARPAYKHLSQAQVEKAVQLCNQIIAEKTDLNMLNQQSLAWRGKGRTADGPGYMTLRLGFDDVTALSKRSVHPLQAGNVRSALVDCAGSADTRSTRSSAPETSAPPPHRDAQRA